MNGLEWTQQPSHGSERQGEPKVKFPQESPRREEDTSRAAGNSTPRHSESAGEHYQIYAPVTRGRQTSVNARISYPGRVFYGRGRGVRKSTYPKSYYLLTPTEEQAFQNEYDQGDNQPEYKRTWEDVLYDSFYTHRTSDEPIPPPADTRDRGENLTLKDIAHELEFPPLNHQPCVNRRENNPYITPPNYVQTREPPYYRTLRGNYKNFDVSYQRPTTSTASYEQSGSSHQSSVSDWLDFTHGSSPPHEIYNDCRYPEYPPCVNLERGLRDYHTQPERPGPLGTCGADGSMRYPLPNQDVQARIKDIYAQIETLTQELRYLKSLSPKKKKRHGYNYYKFDPRNW